MNNTKISICIITVVVRIIISSNIYRAVYFVYDIRIYMFIDDLLNIVFRITVIINLYCYDCNLYFPKQPV